MSLALARPCSYHVYAENPNPPWPMTAGRRGRRKAQEIGSRDKAWKVSLISGAGRNKPVASATSIRGPAADAVAVGTRLGLHLTGETILEPRKIHEPVCM